METCLVFSPPSSLQGIHFGILMEEAESLFRQGKQVKFVYCDGFHHYCSINPQGNKTFCKFCRSCSKRWLKKYLSAGIEIIPLQRKKDFPQLEWKYNSVKDIKAITYKDVYIGYGVMSTYTSATRDPEPDFSRDDVRKYFDFALNHAVYLVDGYHQLCDQIMPSSISIFTGRQIDNRPLFDYSIKHNIPLRNNEFIGGMRANAKVERIIYYDHLPHSIPYNTELLEKIWQMPNEPVEEKERKGREFFEHRRGGIPAGDRVYTGNQKKDLLPADWDVSKRNFVIFNSSEDEFSAVGREFDDYAMFDTQYEGIEAILSNFTSQEYHFYLRVHPNLSRVKFRYHTDLYKLPEKYKNLTVIAATDPCSTYALMDAAEKIIVFGSTMGAEAAYWKKPTILLAGAFYYMLDVCYVPKNIDELKKLIEQELSPKDNYDAIRYGYYLMNRKLLTIPAQYIDYTHHEVKLWPFIVSQCGYAKYWNSLALQKILQTFLLWLASKKSEIALPNPVFVDHNYKKF